MSYKCTIDVQKNRLKNCAESYYYQDKSCTLHGLFCKGKIQITDFVFVDFSFELLKIKVEVL